MASDRYTIILDRVEELRGGHRVTVNYVRIIDTKTGSEIHYETIPDPDRPNPFTYCEQLNREDRAAEFEDDVYLDEIFGYAEEEE